MGTIEIPSGKYGQLTVKLKSGRSLFVLLPDGMDEQEAPEVVEQLDEIQRVVADLPAARRGDMRAVKATATDTPEPLPTKEPKMPEQRALVWKENWTHVGCGWRVFVSRPTNTLLVVQGINVLAATLLVRALEKDRVHLMAGSRFETTLNEVVTMTLRGADGATHRGLLNEIADDGSGLVGSAALEARQMLAGMEHYL